MSNDGLELEVGQERFSPEITSKDPINLEGAVNQQSSGTGCQEMVEETGDEKETDEDEETDHDEETDDHEEFPIEIQIKFLGFIVDELFPAVLKFMSKHYSRLFGCPIQEVGFRQLCYSLEPVELSFNRKQQYDLFNLRSVMILPACGLSKMYGKDWAGAALRICGYIGQAKLADDLRTIIGDCFTPDEESVREDFLKDAFFAFKCPSEKVANSADLIAGNCLNTEKQDGKADNKDNQERLSQEANIHDPVKLESAIVQQRLSPEMKIHDHLEPDFDQQRFSPEMTPKDPINFEPDVVQQRSGTFCQKTVEETKAIKKFPKEIQIKFRDFIHDKLFPAVLDFMSKPYPTYYGVPIRLVQFEQICFNFRSLSRAFDRKQQYDLFKIRDALYLPMDSLFIEEGKDWVGAAIRICGYIGQAELANELRKIPGDCFIPDEEDVAIDPFRDGFLDYSSDEDE